MKARDYSILASTSLLSVVGAVFAAPAPRYDCVLGDGDCRVGYCCEITYPLPVTSNFCWISTAVRSPVCVNGTAGPCTDNPVKFACWGDEYSYNQAAGDTWCVRQNPDGSPKTPIRPNTCPLWQCK